MTNKTKRIISSTVIAVLVIFIMGAALTAHNKSTAVASESMSVEDVVAYQKTCGDMQKQLGKDSIYPIYYVSATNKKQMDNLNGTNTFDNTDEKMIEFLALEWYADNNDMSVTEQDVLKRIETTVTEMKSADNYKEYEAAAENLGTTYEKIIRNDYKTYYFAEILNRVYTHKYEIYAQKNGVKQDGTTDQLEVQEDEFDKYWDAFRNDVTADYKQSESYDQMHPTLEKCRELAEKDITTVSSIKNAGL